MVLISTSDADVMGARVRMTDTTVDDGHGSNWGIGDAASGQGMVTTMVGVRVGAESAWHKTIPSPRPE